MHKNLLSISLCRILQNMNMTKRIFHLRCKGSMVKLKLGRNVIWRHWKQKNSRIEFYAIIFLTNRRNLLFCLKDCSTYTEERFYKGHVLWYKHYDNDYVCNVGNFIAIANCALKIKFITSWTIVYHILNTQSLS